uniref:NADH-ubiquinone oxidoreductase chain 5 n=1 Tax=Gasterophilus pecorum TaxID=204919 RepID=A0A142CH96_9MUSC|nr:NADH dehydrogenase subunit 5 [Gasterophilus pecorum]AMP88107.1 NADH dehydrogenase subunit 5 [Gasterophilus pecorum]
MCTLSCVFLFLASLVLFFCGMISIMYDLTLFIEWEVVSLNSMSIVMTLLFDWMSLIFMSFVSVISALVIFYSSEYMSDEENMDRFIILVIMFVISMAFLIISPNLIKILLGWDGLGLVSYLLVVYFQNVKSYGAGMLTALSNKIGDVALLLSIAWMLNYGGWNYIFYLNDMVNSSDMVIIGGLVMVAGLTKSAQIPFSSWLPAAMAAPTPVSALVHSSTLVTAGVYLLIRFNVLVCSSWLGNVLLLLSGLTMFMAGLGANYEFDLKKIIALSTLSQLGLMMSILAMGFYKLAFFHLLTHALFKALLFMCAGAIIHNMNNNQDIRSMGGLSLMMPMTSSCFNVANLTLCGMPFLAGFYSKDLILEMVSLSYVNSFAFMLFFVSTGLTACYSFRLVYYTMTGTCKNLSLSMVNDEGWIMLSSMVGLLSLSIVGGSMLSWLMFPSPLVVCLPPHLKLLTLFVCIVGGLLGYMMSNVSLYFFNKSLYYYSSTSFLGSMWFMPYISTYGIIGGPLVMGENIFKGFDHGWSEYFGGQQLFSKLIEETQINQVLQDNSLKIYLLSFVFWMIILVGLSIYF